MYDTKFEPLRSGEVLFVPDSLQFILSHSTFRTDEFSQALKQQLLENQIGGLTKEKDGWFSQEGVECEVLRFGSQGWQKGKVRINLEFCPSETGSSSTSQVESNEQGFTSSPPSISEVENLTPEFVDNPNPAVISNVATTATVGAMAVAGGLAAAAVVGSSQVEEIDDSLEIASTEAELELDDAFGDEPALEVKDDTQELDLDDDFSQDSFEVTDELETDFPEIEEEKALLDWKASNSAAVDTLTEAELELDDAFGDEPALEVKDDTQELDLDDSFGDELALDWEATNATEEDADFNLGEDFAEEQPLDLDTESAQKQEVELSGDFGTENELDWSDDTNGSNGAGVGDTEDFDIGDAFGEDEPLNLDTSGGDLDELDLGDDFTAQTELDWSDTNSSNGAGVGDTEDFDIGDAFGEDEPLNLDTSGGDLDELDLGDDFTAQTELDWSDTNGSNGAGVGDTEDFDIGDAFGEDEPLNLDTSGGDLDELDLGDDFTAQTELDWSESDTNGSASNGAVSDDIDFADAFGEDEPLNLDTSGGDLDELDLGDDFTAQTELDWSDTNGSASNGAVSDDNDLDFADAFGDDTELNLTEVSATKAELNLDDDFGDNLDFDLADFDNDVELDLGNSLIDSEGDSDLKQLAKVTEDFDLNSFSDEDDEEVVFDDVWQDISEVKK